MDSPYKRATDSPSRQLLFELGRLRADADEDFHARLEREELGDFDAWVGACDGFSEDFHDLVDLFRFVSVQFM